MVVALIGLLSSAVIIAINPTVRGEQARDAVRKQDLGIIYNALVAYFVDHGALPNAGVDNASGSNEPLWLAELVPDYLKTIPRDPRQAGIFGTLASSFDNINDNLGFSNKNNEPGSVAGVTVPPTNRTYQMPVLVINYMPTLDGVNIDTNITGIISTLASVRTRVSTIKSETLATLEDGSKYHGTGTLTMDYSITAEKEYLEALPIGLPLGSGIYRPDYIQVLNRENICNYVNNLGVKEVWLFGYHWGNIAPVESNMAGPYGDISNSEGTNDMPVCNKTYVLYNYNYDRGSNEATHNHGHQVEAVMMRIDNATWDKFTGPWTTYSSNDGSGSNFHRCGWTHNPPNTSVQYIYNDTRFVWTDCEDWKPDGSGNKVYVNCTRWQCNQRKFHTWRWQGMPGNSNGLAGVTNWWDFIGDFDAAMGIGEKLLYDITSPTVPTNLAATNIYSTQLTLNWSASSDDFAVSGYQVKRNGIIIGSSATASFVDYTVSANTQYSYTVAAVDTSQNISGDSTSLSVTTTSATGPVYDRPVLDSTSYKIGGSSANYCFLHSVGSGQNRYLVVGVGIRSGNSSSVSSIKINNLNLSVIGTKDSGLRTELWGVKNPSSGTGEICVSLTAQPLGGGTIAGASSWNFVNQTTPVEFYRGASGFSASPGISVPSRSDSMVVDVAVMPSNGWVATGAGSGQTIIWNQYASNVTSMGSYKASAPWVTGMSWNTNNEAWNISGVSINLGLPPSPSSSPSVSPSGSPAPSSSPSETPPTESPEEVGCPARYNVFCYTVDPAAYSFVLWARLENGQDSEIRDNDSAKCREFPPNEYYNFCLKY